MSGGTVGTEFADPTLADRAIVHLQIKRMDETMEQDIYDDLQANFEKTYGALRRDLARIRSDEQARIF